MEEQRLYEIVKLKSQFFKTLQDCTSLVPKTLNDVEADEVKDREFRIARRKLEKRKMLATGRKRKYLKIDSGSDSNEEEETIAEAEFKLNNDAEELLLESDINFLSKNDLTVLKLIMVAGLYPNIAIPDPFNSNRPALEHVFHTKAKR